MEGAVNMNPERPSSPEHATGAAPSADEVLSRPPPAHARDASPAVMPNVRHSQDDDRTSLDRQPTQQYQPHRARVTSLHPFPSMASADVVDTARETIAARRARTRARTSSQAPSRLRLYEYPRRHGTVSSRFSSVGPRDRVIRVASVGTQRSGAQDTVDFSLAGTQNTLSAVPQGYVDPGYSDLNPEYVEANSRPVWGLAKPLPRVIRPAMVPTRAEARERRQTLAEARSRQADLQRLDTRRSRRSQRSRRSAEREQDASDKEAVDVERNDIPLSRLRQASVQLGDLRADREDQLLSRYTLQRITSRRDRRSTTASSRERPQPLDHVISPLTPYLEVDEDQVGLGAALATNATDRRPTRIPSTQAPEPAEAPVTTDDEFVTDEEDSHVEDGIQPSVPLPAYDDAKVEILNNHNTWSVIRGKYRAELAEFLAVVVQLTFGFAADLSSSLTGNTSGVFTPLGWGLATMQAIYIAGGISGAHLNPAITIMLAIFRGFPARKIPGYIFAQLLGAFVAALIAYGLFQPGIAAYAGSYTPADSTTQGTNVINSFITSLRQPYITWSTGFLNEFTATAFLVVTVLALGDDSNAPPGAGMNALIVGFVVANLSLCFSFDTGAALNPSRDLGPRLALLALGFDPKDLFLDRAWFWLYGPWAGAITGALVGAMAYDICIFTGGESPVNYSKPNVNRVVERTGHNWRKAVRWERRAKPGKGLSEKELALEEEV